MWDNMMCRDVMRKFYLVIYKGELITKFFIIFFKNHRRNIFVLVILSQKIHSQRINYLFVKNLLDTVALGVFFQFVYVVIRLLI